MSNHILLFYTNMIIQLYPHPNIDEANPDKVGKTISIKCVW